MTDNCLYILEDEIDDIDTGTRYDPDAPLALTSCYNCLPHKWRKGNIARESYHCSICQSTVNHVCLPAAYDC